MKNPIDTIRNGLVSHEAELARDLEEALLSASNVRKALAKVRKAIRALDEEFKDSPNQELVRQIVLGLLQDGELAIPAKRLEALVAKELHDKHGLTAKGLALRMKEVLAGDEFETTSLGARLALTSGRPLPATV